MHIVFYDGCMFVFDHSVCFHVDLCDFRCLCLSFGASVRSSARCSSNGRVRPWGERSARW